MAGCPSCHYLQLRAGERRQAQVVDLQCPVPTLEHGFGLGYPVRDVEAGGSNPLTPTSFLVIDRLQEPLAQGLFHARVARLPSGGIPNWRPIVAVLGVTVGG